MARFATADHIGPETLVGQIAEAVSDIEHEGLVRCGSELWTAAANGIRIPKGTRVRVHGLEGMRLMVRPIGSEGAAPMGRAELGRYASDVRSRRS